MPSKIDFAKRVFEVQFRVQVCVYRTGPSHDLHVGECNICVGYCLAAGSRVN